MSKRQVEEESVKLIMQGLIELIRVNVIAAVNKAVVQSLHEINTLMQESIDEGKKNK